MNNVDELPSWAARTHVSGAEPPLQVPPPKKGRSLRAALLGLLALIALAAMAGLGYWAATVTNDDDNTATSGETDQSLQSQADTDPATESAEGNNGETDAGTLAADGAAETGDGTDAQADGGADGEGTSSEDAATEGTATGNAANPDGEESATEAERSAEPVDNSDGSIRFAVLKGGQLFLRGKVHSEEYGKQIEEVALGVMGPGNVFNEYEVDPTTPDTLGGPIYVEDVVLFDFNSIEVAPTFLPILDLGTALMLQNPTVEIEVVSRTDSIGSEAMNLEVSQLRADAVVNYWAKKGIDTSRLTIDARGEEEASDNDDATEAALNRRVEFVIRKLFG